MNQSWSHKGLHKGSTAVLCVPVKRRAKSTVHVLSSRIGHDMLCMKLFPRASACLCVFMPYMWCYCYKSSVLCKPHGRSVLPRCPRSPSVSHPPLSPPRSIGSNRSPPCIQGLSAGGGGSRDGVIEREIHYWWCLLMTVESCSGPHERAVLDNVCGCNFLRRRRRRVQNKTAKQNISKGRSRTEHKQTTAGRVSMTDCTTSVQSSLF